MNKDVMPKIVSDYVDKELAIDKLKAYAADHRHDMSHLVSDKRRYFSDKRLYLSVGREIR